MLLFQMSHSSICSSSVRSLLLSLPPPPVQPGGPFSCPLPRAEILPTYAATLSPVFHVRAFSQLPQELPYLQETSFHSYGFLRAALYRKLLLLDFEVGHLVRFPGKSLVSLKSPVCLLCAERNV